MQRSGIEARIKQKERRSTRRAPTRIEEADEADYEAAKKRALARMERGFDLGGMKPMSREEIYERGRAGGT